MTQLVGVMHKTKINTNASKLNLFQFSLVSLKKQFLLLLLTRKMWSTVNVLLKGDNISYHLFLLKYDAYF